MNADVSGKGDNSTKEGSHLSGSIAAGVVSWIAISLGCLGLKMLMEARPEFVGPPIRIVRSVLVQESPRLVTRKMNDDVSVINPAQPLASEIRFDMQGRRDYRGLKTISDMAGRFAGRFLVTNSSTEPMFVLFKCPHPRTEAGSGMRNEQDDARPGGVAVPDSNGLYGIGLTRAQHLTVINSDGSCTHFAEFELPATQKEGFRLRLPPSTQLISASLDGVEIRTPLLENSSLCRVQIPARTPGQKAHRLSFRLAYPPQRLGFIGSIELVLPEVFEIAGMVDWVISLPPGFQTQVISSGLVTQKDAADLSLFGDYGNFLKSHPSTRLAKTLAPPGRTTATLKYAQAVPGFQD